MVRLRLKPLKSSTLAQLVVRHAVCADAAWATRTVCVIGLMRRCERLTRWPDATACVDVKL